MVPSNTIFGLRLLIENATKQDLQLISIGLSEFVHGFDGVGGLRSRGLGACILHNLHIRLMELTDAEHKQRLKRYLLRKKEMMVWMLLISSSALVGILSAICSIPYPTTLNR